MELQKTVIAEAESDVTTLYRFADDWKVVELRTEEALEREGDLMGHCVGEYFELGTSRIFSLRDPDNKPHITMVYSPERKHYKQICGPRNAKPKKHTKPYLIEFLKENGNFVDLLNLGIPGKELNLRGADLRGADLEGADLRDADLRKTKLQGAYLRGAKLQHANLSEAELQGASFEGAKLRHAVLRGAKIHGANFRYADLEGANLRGAEYKIADFQDVKYNRKTIWSSGRSHSYLAIS